MEECPLRWLFGDC